MRDWIGSTSKLRWWSGQPNQKAVYTSFLSVVTALGNWCARPNTSLKYRRFVRDRSLLVSKPSRRPESSVLLISQVCCVQRISRQLSPAKFLYQYTVHRAMAWLSRGRNQAELVKALKENGLIKTERVEKTLLAVDRGYFCKYRPYEDSPQPIGWNATISAPHMHVMCLEILNDHLKPGSKVLDIGSG